MRIQKITIIGMGALGMLYGTYISEKSGSDSIRYVMDQERFLKYHNKTFYKNGVPCEMSMIDTAHATIADLVIVAVKYNALESVLETMKKCIGEHTIILSVMNGIVSEEIIAERFGKQHMIYCVAQGMDAVKFGEKLTYTRMGELRIGIKYPEQKKNLDAVQEFFDRIAMPYTLDPDIMRRIWSKFMLNVGINQTCMVYETNYGGCLVPGEPFRTMISAMREVIALSAYEGVNLGEEDINEYVAILKTLSPEGLPSMRQDGVAKRPSEVEMFSGTVKKLAAKHGILVPTNDYLYEQVIQMESKY